MDALDYHPNQIARALQKNQSFFIGIIVPDSNHPFFSDLIKYVEMSANEKNYKLLICNSLDDPEKEANYISMLRQNQVDGIIMCSHTMNIESYKRSLSLLSLLTVLFLPISLVWDRIITAVVS